MPEKQSTGLPPACVSAVTTTTGSRPAAGRDRISRANSAPSISGIHRSVRIRSKSVSSRRISRASRPDEAQALSMPEELVSATLKNKYLQSPFGVYPMKYFLAREHHPQQEGMEAILTPAALSVSWPVLTVLGVSIAVKAWLYFFYRRLGRATDNGTLLAASKDSLSDVLATGAVLISTGLCALFGWRIDGYIGLVVALIVLKAGYEVCRDTVDRLLGGKPDPEKSRRLRELLLNYEGILGIHDLVIHDYGPGRCFASVHAEVSDQCNIVAIHEIIDNAEREIGRELHMPICIHMDPIATEDETTNRVRQQMNDFLREIDPALSMHDFRAVFGPTHTNLVFDVVVPPGFSLSDSELSRRIEQQVQTLGSYFCVITVDHNYAYFPQNAK